MSKPKLLGMKKLAAELADLAANHPIGNRIVAAAAIGFIADHWVFDPGEVHANLVRAAGL